MELKKHFKEGNEVSSKVEWNDEPKGREVHERMMRILNGKNVYTVFGSSVQSFTHVQLFATPCTATCQASRSNNSWSLLKLMYIESVMPSNHLILYHPLLLMPSLFPASGSFPVSQFFASSGQSIGASASALAFPMNIQDWFSLGLTGLISLQPKELSRVSSNTRVQRHQFFGTQYSLWPNSYIHTWQLKKTIALTRCIFVDKVMSDF